MSPPKWAPEGCSCANSLRRVKGLLYKLAQRSCLTEMEPVAESVLCTIDDDRLECPHCEDDGAYLHMNRVITFFDQDGEDGPKTKTEVTRTETTVTPNVSGDEFKIRRRDLLVVEFNCEACGATSNLHLEQHKGQTLVEWKDIKLPTEDAQDFE